PLGARAHVFVEISDPAEEQKLLSPGAVELTWLHRGARPVGEALVAAVRALEFPAGQVHAFVHGEAAFVRELRRLLRGERGVPLDRLSISGYWRRGMDDEGWRSTKAAWNQQVAAEEAAVPAPAAAA
ncbi:siderophore-interacting protein, partial [Micromonospora sp. M51]